MFGWRLMESVAMVELYTCTCMCACMYAYTSDSFFAQPKELTKNKEGTQAFLVRDPGLSDL